MLARTRFAPRPGFTLIELLVVVAIIAVLIALTTAGVQRVRIAAARTTAVSEINQFDSAITAYKSKHGFYPPSHVMIADTATGQSVPMMFKIPVIADPNANTNDGRRQYASYVILSRMYPRWNGTPNAGMGNYTVVKDPSAAAPVPLDYAGTTLDPAQVMNYFLGGPGVITGTSTPGNLGWSMAYPSIPATNATSVYGPYFEYANVLRRLQDPSTKNFDGRFRDAWGTQPYVYFKGNASSRDYNHRIQYPWIEATANDYAPDTYTPPAAPPYVLHPIRSNGQWLNPDKFQIISAGADRQFAYGSYKNASNAIADWSFDSYIREGQDDLANFNNGLQLGAKGN